jgi:hypothetical protein
VLPGDWVIVASDGLDTLTGDEIATAIGNASTGSPADLTRNLLDQVGRKAVPNQDNISVIAVKVHAGQTVAMRLDRQNQTSNGTDDSPNRKRDTEVIEIHGTLIGQAKNKTPAAPTMVIRRPAAAPARRAGLGTLATLFVVLVLVSAVFFVFFFDTFTPRISGGPNVDGTEQAPPQKPDKSDEKG